MDGLYTYLAKALILLVSVNSQFKVQRRKQILDKMNFNMSSLATETFPEAGQKLFGPSFEEKVKKRNETRIIFSTTAPRKSNKQGFLKGRSPNFAHGEGVRIF